MNENEKTGYEELEVEILPLTLQVAKHYDRMTALEGDRDPSSNKGQRRVEILRKLNALGLFYSPVWSTVQVTSENGKKYRVDGGHSLFKV